MAKGALVATPMRFVSAKNSTCEIRASRSVALALILINVSRLNKSSHRGQAIETDGETLVASTRA